MEFDLLDHLKTLCARARSRFLQFLRPIGQNYKSDLSDLVQSDSIDFSCLSPHSGWVYSIWLTAVRKDILITYFNAVKIKFFVQVQYKSSFI